MTEPDVTPKPSAAARPVIWIVDDSPTEALIAEHALGAGYEFERFDDGAVLIERLGASDVQPDLVLLDWVMPGMAGDEVCRFLRDHPRTLELPIILITASRIETADVAEGLASGANDYVARPFATEELRARVDSAIRTKRLSDQARQQRRRLSTINQLGHALFEARTDVDQILRELTIALSSSVCDACAIVLTGSFVAAPVIRHRAESTGEALAAIAELATALAEPVVHAFETSAQARAVLPPAAAAYVARFGLRGLAIVPLSSREPRLGRVTLTRDGGSRPFDDGDLATIETCIEYASLAIESALAGHAVEAERQHTAEFQQQMLAIVGHDLRAPLAAILIATEILAADTRDDPPVAAVVKRIETSGRRMTRMVDQLLDMTRARLGGGIALTRCRTQLLPIVRAALDELHARARPAVRAGLSR